MLPSQTIVDICQAASEKFMKECTLIEFDPPVKICGDIHGDYVDRGSQSLETILYLFLQKIRYPKTVYMLRGNHEIPGINRNYGFYEEIMQRYNDSFIWQVFQDVFNCMPLAALISKRIFCSHGGISPDLKHFDQIRPHEVQMEGYLFECDNHLITVFSAINYTNQFNNAAGVICVDENLKLSVKCLKPS
uniref:Serine/threonine-protein phosphatase n=1 Tax=Romanomermis culicivorax TaxID=13658 RepID=A0A915JY99_ROMCU